MKMLAFVAHRVKRRVLLVVVAFLVVGTLYAPQARAEVSTAACFGTSSNPTIALDPGHGGTDYGTTGYNGLRESELNLDIAFLTRDRLVEQGYYVCLTRTDQVPNWSNSQRAEYANSVGAVRFVLIHLNGSSTESVNYTKTFWGKKSKDLKFSQVMHDALWPALRTDPTDPTKTVNLTDGGVGQFATGALLKSTMPGTLVEAVFLTNKAEADRLSTTSRRQQIATAIATGIVNSLP